LPAFDPAYWFASFLESRRLLDVDLKVGRDRKLLEGIRTITDVADPRELTAHRDARMIIALRSVSGLDGRAPSIDSR